jgi:PST family polysaccharide transporter
MQHLDIVTAPPQSNHEVNGPAMRSERPAADHFATDHLLGDLKGRSMRGGAMTMLAQGVRFLLQLGSTMVLARLLTPQDFGLIAMVSAVTGFVAMFKDAGLSMATVQRAEVTHEQVSTLFWINVALSVLVMLVVAALAPAIAMFYSEPRLTGITLALAATFIFGGLTVQHQALLRRQMRFRALATVEIVSMAAGVGIAVAMAFGGFGYWSLVGLVAGQTVANSVLVWVACGWRPGPPRRASGVRPMLGFGGNATGASVIAYLRRNLDNVLIGSVWGASSLGLYAKAYQLLMLPIRQINAPLTSVAVPALSRLQNDPGGYRRYYRRFIECMVTAGLPIIAFAVLFAEDIVLLVLGPQWDAAVPVFLLLGPAALMGVLNVAGGVVFLSTGRTDRQFKATLLTTPIVVGGFLLGLPYGPSGVAAGFSATFVAVFPWIIWYAFRTSPLHIVDLLAGLWRPGIAAAVAAVGAFVVGEFLTQWPLLARTVAGVAFFGSLYAAVALLLPGGKQFGTAVLRGLTPSGTAPRPVGAGS